MRPCSVSAPICSTTCWYLLRARQLTLAQVAEVLRARHDRSEDQ